MMAKADTDLDPKEILSKLEQEEREARKEFEQKQRDRREKALEGVIKPLRDERNKLAQLRNECDMKIGELDRKIATINGKTAPKALKRTEGGRKRRSADDKLQLATLMHGLMKQKPKNTRFAASDLAGVADGVAPRELIQIWNDKNKDKKIQIEGERKHTRYYLD